MKNVFKKLLNNLIMKKNNLLDEKKKEKSENKELPMKVVLEKRLMNLLMELLFPDKNVPIMPILQDFISDCFLESNNSIIEKINRINPNEYFLSGTEKKVIERKFALKFCSHILTFFSAFLKISRDLKQQSKNDGDFDFSSIGKPALIEAKKQLLSLLKLISGKQGEDEKEKLIQSFIQLVIILLEKSTDERP